MAPRDGRLPNQPDEAVRSGVDPAGNVHVLTRSKNSSGDNDVEVTKYTPAGAVIWSRRYSAGASSNDLPLGLALAPNGDVCVCGETSPSSLFVLRYDAAGTTSRCREG